MTKCTLKNVPADVKQVMGANTKQALARKVLRLERRLEGLKNGEPADHQVQLDNMRAALDEANERADKWERKFYKAIDLVIEE